MPIPRCSTFDDEIFASCTYSGYAHFDSDAFLGFIGEMGLPKDPSRYGAMRKALRGASNAEDEAALKAARNYGGSGYVPPADPPPDRRHQHFGSIIVSCERADLRPVPDGVMIYDDETVRLDPVPVPAIPRAEVIDEFYGAVVEGKPPLHDGAWSRATLEVCLAIRELVAGSGRDHAAPPGRIARSGPVTRRRQSGTESILKHWREAVPDDRLAHLVKDAHKGTSTSITDASDHP